MSEDIKVTQAVEAKPVDEAAVGKALSSRIPDQGSLDKVTAAIDAAGSVEALTAKLADAETLPTITAQRDQALSDLAAVQAEKFPSVGEVRARIAQVEAFRLAALNEELNGQLAQAMAGQEVKVKTLAELVTLYGGG